MKKWLLPGTVALAVILAVAGGTFALAGAFDSDGDRADTAGEQEGDAARCAEGAEDCDDTGGDTLGVCAPDWDPEVDGPCNDTVVVDDGGLNMCIAGAEDCNDMVEEPITSGDDVDPGECSAVHNIDACQGRAIEIVFADFESLIGSPAGEITVTGVEFTDWPNACLGVDRADRFCAEVITPGFKITLETAEISSVYHTNIDGSAFVLAEPGE